MKKTTFLLVMILGFMLCLCSALAVSDDTAGVANMPAEVQKILEQKWNGCTITGWVNPAGQTTSSACGFASINHKGTNILVAFGYKNDQWVYRWKNDDAGTQQKGITLALYEASGESSNIAFTIREWGPENCPVKTWWVKDRKSGSFLLTKVILYDTDGETVLAVQQVTDSKVTYKGWLTGERTVSCRGSVQRDIRYFSFRAFPRTPDKMKKKLTVAPDIPASDELCAEEVRFTGGKKYAVYSAPDDNSLRAGKNKAAVSTNGWIQVFGQEDDWILIQYSIDSNHYRFGYIPAKALPKKTSVRQLDFDCTREYTARGVTLTDDPLYSRAALIELPEGSAVTWLATMGEWAYIESTNGDYLRGFVPAAALRTDDISVKR